MFLMVGFADGLGLTLRLATSGLRFSIDKGSMAASAAIAAGDCSGGPASATDDAETGWLGETRVR